MHVYIKVVCMYRCSMYVQTTTNAEMLLWTYTNLFHVSPLLLGSRVQLGGLCNIRYEIVGRNVVENLVQRIQ